MAAGWLRKRLARDSAVSQTATAALQGAADDSAVPRHIAIVMDGNGRWAKKRHLPRVIGHKYGVDALMRVIRLCADRGVRHVTVFAFSSENWNRPEQEVSGLMGLFSTAVAHYLQKMNEEGVRIHIVGDRSRVADSVLASWRQAEEATAANTRISVTVAFNYGGRWDIVQACQQALRDGLAPEALTEEALSGYMAMRHLPDPDLFIRTGGEYRISNFLLWQSAYTEFFFSPTLWPDFDAADIDAALASYAGRERRFGRVLDAAAPPPSSSSVSPSP
ncbi:polyprenyl diphosphate synthase [Amphibiibacter pelophylacis]|uniref:Polyprenyl diphosphate synthase n=1 Tax=Amphibiibacter pelophylacis TaxID=1799477 RepID=A0ACC6NZ72_9BURK